MGPFHDDVEWNDLGFLVGNGSIPPLMACGSSRDKVWPAGFSGLDNRSLSHETGLHSSFSDGAVFDMVPSQWPGEGREEVANWGAGVHLGREEWNQRQSTWESDHYPPRRGDFRIDPNTHSLAQPGHKEFLTHRSKPHRNRPPLLQKPAGPDEASEKHFQRQLPTSASKKRRGRGRRREPVPLGAGSVPVSSTSQVSKPTCRQQLSSSSGKAERETRLSDRAMDRESPRKMFALARESTESLQGRRQKVFADDDKKCSAGGRRPTHEALDGIAGRSLSPMTIEERLGPHIPGSGSVQNRLGPRNEVQTGVHSRLGPEENSSLDNIHSVTLKSEETKTSGSESIQFRLGPEEHLHSIHSSSTIHSRLGRSDNADLAEPLSSHSLLERDRDQDAILEPLPHSTGVYSRLGHKELDRESLTPHSLTEISEALTSSGLHSRLGPGEDTTTSYSSCSGIDESDRNFTLGRGSLEVIQTSVGLEESFGGPVYSTSVCSEFESRGEEFSGALAVSQPVHSRLGPEQGSASEDIHLRLGPAISLEECRHPETEPILSAGTLVDFSDAHLQVPGELPTFETPDLDSRCSLNFNDIIPGKSPECERFCPDFSSTRSLTSVNAVGPVSDGSERFMVLDDASDKHPPFSNISGSFTANDINVNTSMSTPATYSLCSPGNIAGSIDHVTPTSQSIHLSNSTSNMPDFQSESHTLREMWAPNNSADTNRPPLTGQSRWEPAAGREAISGKTSRNKVGKSQGLPSEHSRSQPSHISFKKQQNLPSTGKKKVVKRGDLKRRTRKLEDSNRSLYSSYAHPQPPIGYRGLSGDGKRESFSDKKDQLPSVSTSGEEMAMSTVEACGMELRQRELPGNSAESGVHSEMERRSSKVGVATVVRAEREMEEGELTDSECEDLVIDLDTSLSSSAAAPSSLKLTATNEQTKTLKPEEATSKSASAKRDMKTASSLPKSSGEVGRDTDGSTPGERRPRRESASTSKLVHPKVENTATITLTAAVDSNSVCGTTTQHLECVTAENVDETPPEKSLKNKTNNDELSKSSTVKSNVDSSTAGAVERPSLPSQGFSCSSQSPSDSSNTDSQQTIAEGSQLVGSSAVDQLTPRLDLLTPHVDEPEQKSPSEDTGGLSMTQKVISEAENDSELEDRDTTSKSGCVKVTSQGLVESSDVVKERECSPQDYGSKTRKSSSEVSGSSEIAKEREMRESDVQVKESEAHAKESEMEALKAEGSENQDPTALEGERRCLKEAETNREDLKPDKNKDLEANEEEPAMDERPEIDTISISSGEILSSTPPSPSAENSNMHDKMSTSDQENPKFTVSDPQLLRGSFRGYDLRDPNYFHSSSSTDAREAVLKPYGGWRAGRVWHKQSRELLFRSDGRRRRFRSFSRSPSPRRSSRHECFSRQRWRRCSSPNEVGWHQRRYRHSRASHSPEIRRGRTSVTSGNWRRKGTDDGERNRQRRGERRFRSSRSCDRVSDRGSCESYDEEEDLEVLELRKEAILSMLSENRIKTSEKSTTVDATAEKKADSEKDACGKAKDENEQGSEDLKEDNKNLQNFGRTDLMKVSDSRETVREEREVEKVSSDSKIPFPGTENWNETLAVNVLKSHDEERAHTSQSPSAVETTGHTEPVSERSRSEVEKSESVKSLRAPDILPEMSVSKTTVPVSSNSTQAVVQCSAKSHPVTSRRSPGKKVGGAVATAKLSVAKGTKSSSRSGSPSSSLGSPVPPSLDPGGSGIEVARCGTETVHSNTKLSTSVKVQYIYICSLGSHKVKASTLGIYAVLSTIALYISCTLLCHVNCCDKQYSAK